MFLSFNGGVQLFYRKCVTRIANIYIGREIKSCIGTCISIIKLFEGNFSNACIQLLSLKLCCGRYTVDRYFRVLWELPPFA